METVEIHSKAFVIKWTAVPDNCSIKWQLKPNKKSINFGIFRRPNDGSDNSHGQNQGRPRQASVTSLVTTVNANALSLDEKLKASGLQPVYWHGKCHANSILKGSYSVASGSGGIFAFVFDNTFSKTLSKTVQFAAHSVSLTEQLEQDLVHTSTKAVPTTRRRKNSVAVAARSHTPPLPGDVDDRYHTGVLLKKRRKKLQGYARRYFSLDCNSGMLSYYHDVSSSLLRGSIPLAIAAVSVKPQTREIFIDSGAEIWNLRAVSDLEFENWRLALERAFSRVGTDVMTESLPQFSSNPVNTKSITVPVSQLASPFSTNWNQLEEIGARLNDAVKLSTKLIDPSSLNDSYLSLDGDTQMNASFSGAPSSIVTSTSTSTSVTPQVPSSNSSTVSSRRQPFWRKKSRSDFNSPATFSPPTPRAVSGTYQPELAEELHKLLEDISSQYRRLLDSSGARTLQRANTRLARLSMDGNSVNSDNEFFDAEEDAILVLQDDDAVEDIVVVSDEEDANADSNLSSGRSSMSSSTFDEYEDEKTNILSSITPRASGVRDLYPLPILSKIRRRASLPPNSVMPPSLIQFVRKNVGKDLSTIAMPVTANEPLSLLQRCSECFEYADLLHSAAHADVYSGEQMMYITAFAVSTLSNNRSKDRALRKPFNPMLNETYELVREDLQFRYLAEKISHRPPIMATYAEAERWTYSYCPQTSQKFWGKSAEIINEGKIVITIVSSEQSDEENDGRAITYSYSMPTTFLRNVIGGEKYIEPSGQMSVLASSGHKAVIEFKAKSMFSGQRSEDVQVKIFSPDNQLLESKCLSGKWTSDLITASGHTVWSVGRLLPDPKLHYGMTEFCATLNEITPIEKGHIAPTDSRLRPDQRCLEEVQIEEAEALKKRLEELQREKRRLGQIAAEGTSSVWFTKIEDGVWIPKQGEQGYWLKRKESNWDVCPTLW
ncbi:Oxysterol-binding protein-domain-containing protein [Dipodascopsis uninucleata]